MEGFEEIVGRQLLWLYHHVVATGRPGRRDVSTGRVDGFFYGLFMDVGLLEASGVMAENPRKAYVDGYSLRIGDRATLVPAKGGRAYGMVLALTHGELDLLYGAPGLESYRPEALQVTLMDGGSLPALCYNLLEAPAEDERNDVYAAKLREVLGRLGFPAEYVASVE